MGSSARFAIPALLLAALAACRASVAEPELPPAIPSAVAEKPLSRAECVELALRSTPNRAAWNARIDLARARLEQARLLPNPTLSLAWEDFGLNAAARHSEVESTLSLAMALEDLFARKGRARVAKHELRAEESRLRAEIARTAAEVSRAHDRLVAARARAAASHELEHVADAQRVATEKFVAAGILAAIELKRAEAEHAQARAETAASEAQARARELELAFALGFERPVALTLSEGLTDVDRAPAPELETLLARAAAQRPELSAASEQYAAELERLRLTASRLAFLPVIGAGPRSQGDELRGVATIEAVLPIFDTGAAAKAEGEASLLAAAADARAAARDVAREVCLAAEARRAALAFLDGPAREVSLRRRRLREDSERLFEAGELDYADLALARRDEVEARKAELDAQLALALAQIDLDAALGTPVAPPP